jgi:thioredoxin 1
MKHCHFVWCIAISAVALTSCSAPKENKNTPNPSAKVVTSPQFDQWKGKGEVIDFKAIRSMFKTELDAFTALINSGYDVIIDFYAAWCGPCKNMAPSFASAARQFPDKLFVKVDIDKFEALASHARVSSIPTIKFFKNGALLETSVGQKSEADLKKVIKKHYK